jgi:hypothetical protein
VARFHGREKAHELLSATEAQFCASLPDDERKAYLTLREHSRGVYRICRGLAIVGNGEFTLGYHNLRVRLGIPTSRAASNHVFAITRRFRWFGILEIKANGQPTKKGQSRSTTVWKWLWPLPENAISQQKVNE